MAAKKTVKKIKVHRVRKVLHVGIDLVKAPWTGTLVKAMPINVENHGPHTDDSTASVLQLYRPEFPRLQERAGPGPMNRMARVMRNYELVITHGDRAFPAAMGHTLFGQALNLPPLVHYYHRVGEVPKGWWTRFRHRLGLARTPLVIVPTEAAARSVTADWNVPGQRIRILPPVFPKPKGGANIPRLMKRDGEKWLGLCAADAIAYLDQIVSAMIEMDNAWHMVVFGSAEETNHVRAAFDAKDIVDRLHVTDRFHGPGAVAALFDLALLDGSDGHIPSDMPALMAAGVPVIALAPDGLGELLPEESRSMRISPGADLASRLYELAQDDGLLTRSGKANAAFADRHNDPAPHLSALAQVLGLMSLQDR
ncbi:glycosyltransferase [Croceicoccus gelatinilyticus]|uniref:glycosyltransferase n=1 Tax=Croceicoccus gelatinilyticus TaxID=2835536 RepID=UPI001BD07A33|nr:glycosyltransferase [Croceicoccus gelatinilyticus]MBS7670570.1 glycosyltransferase [Croceicoccus gelatinilyticus]